MSAVPRSGGGRTGLGRAVLGRAGVGRVGEGRAVLAGLVALALVATACGGGGGADRGQPAATSVPAGAATTVPIGEVLVSAAASLTEAFGELGAAFEGANPGATATFNFGSSGTVARQVVEGAPVDVLATADEVSMATVADAGAVVGEPTVFARNALVVVVRPGNPAGVADLADLATVGTLSLCVDTAPCGRLARQVLEQAGVAVPTDRTTLGQDVKDTLGAVTRGDADAAIVYATDAAAAPGLVDVVDLGAAGVVTPYPIAVVGEGPDPGAEAFVAFVTGPAGQAILARHGFLPP